MILIRLPVACRFQQNSILWHHEKGIQSTYSNSKEGMFFQSKQSKFFIYNRDIVNRGASDGRGCAV